MPNLLNGLKKSWMVFALSLLLVRIAAADIQTIVFEHGETKVSHLLVISGSEVTLKNDNSNAVYNISLINDKSGKSLVSVAEIPAGNSVKMEFSKEGIYRLYYSLQPDDTQNADRYMLIKVIGALPA